MLDPPAELRLQPLHRLWRLFPSRARRRVLARATALVAPRPDRVPPPARHGLAVGGELSRASGLGEGARLMLHGVERLGLPAWPVDVGTPVGRQVAEVTVPAGDPPPPGAPLALHVNGPVL